MSSIPSNKWRESLSADSTGCCAILDKNQDQRCFKNETIIADEDYLSRLPLDCRLKISTFLNHDDLDATSLVNQTLYSASKLSRKKPSDQKERALSLEIKQVNHEGYLLCALLKKDEGLFLENDADGSSREGKINGKEMVDNYRCIDEDPNPSATPIPCHVISRMKFLLDRYNFENKITIHSVLIDLSFIDHCEKIFAGIRIDCRFIIMNSSFGDDLRSQPKRFTNWILSMHVRYMEFWLNKMPAVDMITEEFLQILSARAHRNEGLNIKIFEHYDPEKKLQLGKNTIASLAKFDQLIADHFLIEGDCIMDMVKARLRREVVGSFRFSCNRFLSEQEIEAAIDHDMKYTNCSIEHLRIHEIRFVTDMPKHYYVNISQADNLRTMIDFQCDSSDDGWGDPFDNDAPDRDYYDDNDNGPYEGSDYDEHDDADHNEEENDG